MTEKKSYNARELAEAMGISMWKIWEMLRNNKIRHIHLNDTHQSARIPKDEFERLVNGLEPNKD